MTLRAAHTGTSLNPSGIVFAAAVGSGYAVPDNRAETGLSTVDGASGETRPVNGNRPESGATVGQAFDRSTAALPGVIVPQGQTLPRRTSPSRSQVAMTAVEPVLDLAWADEVLPAGPADEVSLRRGTPVPAAQPRALAAGRQQRRG